jgi:hypothetical protein
MWRQLLQLVGSVRTAVPLLIAIAIVLAWGTIYETRFGTAAVQRFVYHAWWFQALLAFLAMNLAIAAVGRLPWKRKHAPFLLAHLGIILILLGGILGGRFGIEGQLIIPEGQAERLLELPNNVLVIRQPNPGVQYVIPTNFEATAWVREPHALFQVPLRNRSIAVVVDRYYPNAAVDERITEDGAVENPALRLLVSHGGQEDTVWLLARDPQRFGVRWGEAHLLFLEPTTPQQLAGLLGVSQASGPSRGVVTVELTDLKLRRDIPVPERFDQLIPIDGTPYVVRFKEYFNDFAIAEQGIVNRSDEPNNPAVALTLSGPEGTDAFLVFALHPDFQAIHGQQHTIHAHVSYAHAVSQAVPPDSICLVRHPSGALSCVLSGSEGERHAAACEVGRRYTHPWLDYQFEVLASYPRAKVTAQFINRGDEVRAEALHVMAQEGSATAEGWLGLRGSVELALGTEPIIVEYRPAQQELPVTIKLLDFRKIDYPGTQMAAGFESDVELTDPKRGIILMRKISMNNPLRYRGYSFFQSSYLPAAPGAAQAGIPGTPETTVLSVRNDPGTPLVYAGFIIVILGVVAMFILRSKAAS